METYIREIRKKSKVLFQNPKNIKQDFNISLTMMTLEKFTINGIANLNCGHLFAENDLIEYWINNYETIGQCPKCFKQINEEINNNNNYEYGETSNSSSSSNNEINIIAKLMGLEINEQKRNIENKNKELKDERTNVDSLIYGGQDIPLRRIKTKIGKSITNQSTNEEEYYQNNQFGQYYGEGNSSYGVHGSYYGESSSSSWNGYHH
ncbi:hypothetical protein Mgra_00009497 [Meloidogyne graminicola]|uniref:Uncharacterized protein n=1 Tax=Meloidogyne graminicola TaxID=189291 RepID=A0A8S9ZB90_9BILA|nr:hypothetical protein Mgra_00009497 [Meloidogyne graminicola]